MFNISCFGDNLKSFEPIDPNTIEESASKLFKQNNEVIREISFLGRGEASAVFKVTTNNSVYTLKTALYPERTKKILNEAKIRQMFIDKGVTCVPAPRYVDRDFFKNGAVVFDFVEGTHSDYQDEITIRRMASNLADIHNIKYKVISDGLIQLRKNHQALKKTMNHIETDYPYLMNDKISKAFSLAINEYSNLIEDNKDLFPFGISGIMHGDLGGHFITDPQGKVWLVDWENSEYGDLVEEVSSFILYSEISDDMRQIFFEEYKKHFSPASELNFEEIGYFYIYPIPAFNVCWGIDQLDTNLVHKLEPERKLHDIKKSAQNWKQFFSESASNLIQVGIKELIVKLKKEYNLTF